MAEGSGRSRPVPSAVLDAVFGALAHPARRQILVSLFARGGVMTAGEIADRFKCSWPTTTRHLAVLTEAKLLESGKQGRYRLYTLSTPVAVRVARWVLSWAAVDPDPGAERPDWTRQPYANMRNAVPPKKPRRKPV